MKRFQMNNVVTEVLVVWDSKRIGPKKGMDKRKTPANVDLQGFLSSR